MMDELLSSLDVLALRYNNQSRKYAYLITSYTLIAVITTVAAAKLVKDAFVGRV